MSMTLVVARPPSTTTHINSVTASSPASLAPSPPLFNATAMATKLATVGATECSCPSCGLTLPPLSDAHTALLQAQKQIADLEAQVRLLNQKASAAVDRWADYEDELSRLRAASITSAATNSTNPQTPQSPPASGNTAAAASPRTSFLPAGAASRISQLLAPRKSTSNLQPSGAAAQHKASHSTGELPLDSRTTPRTPTQTNRDLLQALSREKELRAAAEARVDNTSKEVEELSVTLFEQANEMVATERRARARLEERVSVLEKRDLEKRDRLERLESAMGRLDRVRALLGESESAKTNGDQNPGS